MADVNPTEARDFVMARLAACRANIYMVADALDDCLCHFADPDGDKEGKERAELLEAIDDGLGEAARAVQMAQDMFGDIDTAEGEPEMPEGDGHDPETDDTEDDDDDADDD